MLFILEPNNLEGVNTRLVLIGGGWMSGREPSGSSRIM